MGFFDFLFGGTEAPTEEELKAKDSLKPHEMWCSRCKYIIGGCVEGFCCSEKKAQPGWTGRDYYSIGETREAIRKPCCNGENFIPRHVTDPTYDDDITNF